VIHSRHVLSFSFYFFFGFAAMDTLEGVKAQLFAADVVQVKAWIGGERILRVKEATQELSFLQEILSDLHNVVEAAQHTLEGLQTRGLDGSTMCSPAVWRFLSSQPCPPDQGLALQDGLSCELTCSTTASYTGSCGDVDSFNRLSCSSLKKHHSHVEVEELLALTSSKSRQPLSMQQVHRLAVGLRSQLDGQHRSLLHAIEEVRALMDAEMDERRIPPFAALEAFCENGRRALEQHQTEVDAKAAREPGDPHAGCDQRGERGPEQPQRRRWADMMLDEQDDVWVVTSSAEQKARRVTATWEPEVVPAQNPRAQRRSWADMTSSDEGEEDHIWLTASCSHQKLTRMTAVEPQEPSTLPERTRTTARPIEPLHSEQQRRSAELLSESPPWSAGPSAPSAAPRFESRKPSLRVAPRRIPNWIPNPLVFPTATMQPPVLQVAALRLQQGPATTRR